MEFMQQRRQFTYGPAMQALRPSQRAFVIRSFEMPGASGPAILAACGDKASPEARKHKAYRYRCDPRVQEAMKEVAASMVHSDLPLAASTIHDTLTDPKHRDRAKVAFGLYDRAGISPVQKSETTVTHKVDTRGDLLGKIAMLLEKHNEFALPKPVKVIEADYKEVADD
jgi:hypothetical protein